MDRKKRNVLRLAGAALVMVLLLGLVAVLASGCGAPTGSAAVQKSEVASDGAGASLQQEAADRSPEQEQAPAVQQQEQPAAQAAPADGVPATEEVGNPDCPFYEDGICSKTGEPCTDCR